MKWTPRDVIAVLVICISGGLMLKGYDSIIALTNLAVVAAYYGINIAPIIRLRARKRDKGEG